MNQTDELKNEVKLAQEAEWVQQVTQGNQDALIKLYEAYIDPVYGYFFNRTRSTSEAEALTSETFTRAVEALMRHHYTWQGKPFGAWLFGIAGRILQERNRKRGFWPLF